MFRNKQLLRKMAPRYFANLTFCQLGISPNGHFTNLTPTVLSTRLKRPHNTSALISLLNPNLKIHHTYPLIYLASFPYYKTTLCYLAKWQVDEMIWHPKQFIRHNNTFKVSEKKTHF